MAEPLEKRVLQALKPIDFAERYYRFYEQNNENGDQKSYTQTDIADFLEGTGLAFKYHKREKFFAYRETSGNVTIGLHIAFPHSQAELILVVKEGQDASGGGPFAGVAYELKQQEEPGFSYSPRYPKPEVATKEGLKKALKEGVALFQDAKAAILSHLADSPEAT